MTVKRTAFMKQLLEFSGVDPERLVLKWVSSAEGPRFAQVVTDFVEKICAHIPCWPGLRSRRPDRLDCGGKRESQHLTNNPGKPAD
jgi:hypothetical protein